MACKIYVNGQESLLFNNILEAYDGNEDLATSLHSYFNSSDFIEYFGDWKSDYESDIKSVDYNYNKNISRIEDNGEPKLFKNESNNNYYYIDKYKNKEYVIFNSKSLNSLFTFAEIKQLTEVLSFNFIKNNINLDFENIDLSTTIGTTLRQSIIDKLNERITTFNATGDYLWEDKAESLQQALDNNLDEIVNNVKTYFQQSKLEYNELKNENLEDTDLENIEIAENEKDPGFGVASFERSTKENTSANVKLRLSLIEDVSQKDYFLNDVTYVKFDEIYSTLLNTLNTKVALDLNNSQEDLFNIYKEEIAKLANKKPYFKELYRIISKPDFSDDIKSEFVQAFNLDKQAYNTSVTKTTIVEKDNGLITLEDGTIIRDRESVTNLSHDILNVANVGSRETEVFSQWNNNFKTSFVSLDGNKSVITPQKRELLKLIKSNVNKARDTKDINLLVDSLRNLGVETTRNGFQHYLDNLELVNNDTELSNKLFGSAISSVNYFIDNIIANKNTNYNNALTDQSVFRELARAEAFYISEGSDSSVYTAGKQKWVYSYPSYLSTTIKSWKKNRDSLLNLYNISKYTQGSDWMKYLLAIGDTYQVNEFASQEDQESERIEESKKRINQLDIASFNTIQEDENAAEGLDNKNVDKATYITDTVNKLLAFTKNAKSYYRTTTPADKGTQYELHVGRNHSTNARYNSDGSIGINTSSSEVIFEYFNSEYKRMKFEREFVNDPNTDQTQLSTYYHLGAGHAFKSQIFPSLSFDKIRDEMNKLPLEDRFNSIYDENGIPSLNDLNNPVVKSKILKYINSELSSNIIKTLDSLTNAGVFELNNGDYINKRLDSKIWNSYQRDNALKASSDFYINSIISHVEYSKMFSGDIAYYKNGIDYKKRVPATYTDGLQLRLNDVNKDYNIAVTESVNIGSPFHAEIEELVGEDIASYYGPGKINSADAQAWITPSRWKALFKSLGKWNTVYESSYQKLIGNDPTPFTAEELKKVAPPVKGVYFQVIDGRPIFLKYSQAVLSPRLRSGNGLEKLYNQMITQSIDELLTFDAIKVGSNKPTKVHDDQGNVLDNVKFNVMTIPSNGWKLQQDLPVKTFKETEVGSQIQKNIFQGLAFNLEEQFQLDNTEYTGNEIAEQIADVIGDLSNKGYSKVLNEFGIGTDGIITNIEGFYRSITDEIKERGGSSNIIQALEAETSIYGIPQAQSKLQNIFGSIMNSRILKVKTNGGSFVQMSNFGLTKEDANKQGVIWSPNALSTTHEPQFLKDSEGNFVLSPTGKKIVRPGGILLSGSFIAKYIPDYRKYTAKELFISYKGGNPIIDKKIQENIIGYRIPNQGLSSNDALEIVGILPEENGDTVVAYTGITTKTGSDFDIDKMYMMFPSYKNNDGKLEYVNYDSNLRPNEQSLEAVQNRLIELYKSVLTNENVIKEVMTPIDFDHMKNDIRSMVKQVTTSNLSLYDPIQDIETKYSFLAGKAGVGQEANALIDYVLGSLSNISISNFEIAKSNPGKLDHQYSQELDENDLKYYQKELNLSESEIEGLKKIKISHSLSAILNAFVDIAKDPYITEGNWVTMTTNTGNLLLRKGVHPFYVNAFLAQPIIKKYIDFTEQYEKSDDQALSTRDEFRKQYVKEQLANEEFTLRGKYSNVATMYDELLQDSDINSKKAKDIKKGNNSFTINNILKYLGLGEIPLSPSEITDMRRIEGLITETHSKIFFPSERDIIENNSLQNIRKNLTGDNIEFQAKVFNDFLRYQNASKAVKINIDGSKFMVNGMGKNVTSLNIAKNIVDSITYKEEVYNESDTDDRGNIILGFNSKFQNPNGSESMFSKYYNNIILGVQKIVQANPKLFLSANQTVQNTFDEISFSIYDDILIDDLLGTQLEKDFYSYTMSGFTPFQISVEERRNLISNFPERIKAFKDSHKGIYEIIDQLTIKSAKSFDFISLSNRKKSTEFEETLTNSWYDLMRDEPEISDNLIKYSFFTSGFAMNINQFYTYIPSQWFIENKINRFIIDQSNQYSNQDTNIDNFIDQFYMSNIEDRSRVRVIKPYRIDTANSLTDINKGFVSKKPGKSEYFVVRKVDDDLIYYKLLGYTNELKAIYSRFIPNMDGNLVDVRNLNFKDERGNKVINFNTEGLILKLSPSINPALPNIDYLNSLSEAVIYPRDYFFRENYVDNKQMYFDEIEEGNEVEIVINSTTEYTQEFFDQLDKNNISNQLIIENYTLLSIEDYNNENVEAIGDKITEDNLTEALDNPDRILYNGSETEIPETNYYVDVNEEFSFDYSGMTSKEIYNDYLNEKDLEAKEASRKLLVSLGLDLKTQEEIDRDFKDPNQLSLFDENDSPCKGGINI